MPAALALSLTACATAPSSPSATLPALYQYAPDVQTRAAEELGEALMQPCPREIVIEGCSATARLVLDYAAVRAAIRAVDGAK